MAKKLTQEEFIKRARIIHGDKYNYSKVEYTNVDSKVCIICPKHGEFWQTPSNHLHGKGCKECAREKSKIRNLLSKEEFIKKARKVHGDKYDYSKVEYVNSQMKVCIVCPIHGEFWQTPNSHLSKHGCPKCKIDDIVTRQTMTTSVFVEKSKKIHGNKYDYSKVNYIDAITKVCIVCPKHGEFWQRPTYHLNKCGCPKCNQSKLETEIEIFLIKNKIEFKQSEHLDFLGIQHLDFYLPQYNIALECQGEQHYEVVKHFGGKKNFKVTKERDQRKKKLCKENGVKLLYFTHYEGINEDNIEIFKDKEKLLEEILKHKNKISNEKI